MIQLVKRTQLNDDKYNACISKSLQSRIYAYSWYLDVVANNWSVLVLDDYEAVMPLPWNHKFGLRYITQPFFTQQLGVFSKENLSKELMCEFIKSVPKRFLKITLQFNSDNQFLETSSTKKDNFILALNSDYNALYKNFSKGRKHAILQGLKNELTLEEVPFSKVLALSKKNYSFKELSDKEYQKLTTLVQVLKNKQMVSVLGVKWHNQLIGGAVFILDVKRIVYLFSAISPKGKEMQAGSLLLNTIIKNHATSLKTLDFEGSSIPGVATFFKSFGATNITYSLFKKRVL